MKTDDHDHTAAVATNVFLFNIELEPIKKIEVKRAAKKNKN